MLDGTERPGRYNRPGERTLYASGSRAGVRAAVARYGDAPRALMRLEIAAERLLDLRDTADRAALGIAALAAVGDWQAALARGEEPPSWHIADQARAIGAAGLIDPSRRAPGEWHLVLFGWNRPGLPRVVAQT